MQENESKKKNYIFLDNGANRIPNWLKQAERGKTMKYIRTCTGVYGVEDDFMEDSVCVFGEGCVRVLQTAKTIEELCDEFVFIDKTCQHTHLIYKKQFFRGVYDVHKRADLNETIYGAIWTDKGLIYVAKMNDKGELELL